MLEFDTRAAAMATAISASENNIIVDRYATGYMTCPARYIRGTGPATFNDANGNPWCLDLSGGEIEAAWFGVGSGGDDRTAFSALASYGGGKIIRLRPGVYFTSDFIAIPSVSTWIGDGRLNTTIQATGSGQFPHAIIYGNNVGNARFEGINFVGNNIATSSQTTGALLFEMDVNMAGAVGPVTIRNCGFSNFKHDYWVRLVLGTQAPYSADALIVEDCVFTSVSGNERSYSAPDLSSMISAWGNTVLPGGTINRVIIRRNLGLCQGVLSFLTVWANVGNWTISDNEIREAGYYLSTLANVYAVLTYTADGPSASAGNICGYTDQNLFTNNKIYNTYWGGAYIGPGAGHYAAENGAITSDGNFVTAIIRDDNTTLRRAGLSYNGTRKLICVNNETHNCATGIAVSGPAEQLVMPGQTQGLQLVGHNSITSQAGGSNGLNISWNDGTGGGQSIYVVLDCNLISVQSTKVVKTPGTHGTISEINTLP